MAICCCQVTKTKHWWEGFGMRNACKVSASHHRRPLSFPTLKDSSRIFTKVCLACLVWAGQIKHGFSFFFLETGFLYVALTSWNSLCRPVWPWTQRDPSTSQVLGLKMCITTPRRLSFFTRLKGKRRLLIRSKAGSSFPGDWAHSFTGCSCK